MKLLKLKLFLIIFPVFFTLVTVEKANAQCKDESGVFKCAEMFTPEGITFMNEFLVDGKKRKTETEPNGQEFDVTLLGGRKYRFALCCYTGLDDLVLTLYDDNNPEATPLGSTFKDGKDVAFFDYICTKEGLYKVSIRFKPGKGIDKKMCAIGLLGYGGKVSK